MYDVKAQKAIDLHDGTVVRQASSVGDFSARSGTSPEARLLEVLQKVLESGQPPMPLQDADISERLPPLTARILGILQRDHAVDPARDEFSPVEAAISPKDEWLELEGTQPDAGQLVDDRLGVEPRAAPSLLLSALKSLAIVAFLTVAGFAVGMFLSGPPSRYTSRITISAQEGAGTRGPLLRASLRKLESASLLSAAVVALKLDRDPDFAGGKETGWNVAMDLLSADGGASDPASRAEAALKRAVDVAMDEASGRIVLAVTTADVGKSERIAGYLADAIIKDAPLATARSNRAQSLRKAFEQAQSRLEDFRKQASDGKIKAALDLEQQQRELDVEVTAADTAFRAARAKSDAIKSAKLTEVLNGALSPDLMSTALQGLRDRYAAANLALAQLSTDLGPRHPRRLAQQVVVDDLRADVQKEMGTLADQGEADLKAATDRQKELIARRAHLGEQAGKIGVDMAQLRQLEDQAQSARAQFEEALQQKGGDNVKARPVLTASSAKPVVAADKGLFASPAACGLAGFGIGMSVVLLSAFRSRRKQEIVETEPAPSYRAANVPSGPSAILDQELENVELVIGPPTARQEDIELLRREMATLRMRMHSYAERRQA